MERLKSQHKAGVHASVILAIGLFIAVGSSISMMAKPDLSSRVARALFSHNVHVVPNKAGFASIEVSDSSIDSAGVGTAKNAGERFNMQMSLSSSVDK